MFRCTGLSRRLLGLVLVVVPCQFCGCTDLCVLCADALCSPQGPSALDLPPGPTPAPSPAPSPVMWPLPSSDPNPSSGVAHTVCHRPQGTGDAFALNICRSVGVRGVDTLSAAVVLMQSDPNVMSASACCGTLEPPGTPASPPHLQATPYGSPSTSTDRVIFAPKLGRNVL